MPPNHRTGDTVRMPAALKSGFKPPAISFWGNGAMSAPAPLLILLTGFLFDDILAAFADPNDSRVFLGPIAVKASAKPGEPQRLAWL